MACRLFRIVVSELRSSSVTWLMISCEESFGTRGTSAEAFLTRMDAVASYVGADEERGERRDGDRGEEEREDQPPPLEDDRQHVAQVVLAVLASRGGHALARLSVSVVGHVLVQGDRSPGTIGIGTLFWKNCSTKRFTLAIPERGTNTMSAGASATSRSNSACLSTRLRSTSLPVGRPSAPLRMSDHALQAGGVLEAARRDDRLQRRQPAAVGLHARLVDLAADVHAQAAEVLHRDGHLRLRQLARIARRHVLRDLRERAVDDLDAADQLQVTVPSGPTVRDWFSSVFLKNANSRTSFTWTR